MKKQIIKHANGENANTYGPLCFLENFKGDLNEQVDRFVSWDCDIPIFVNRYKIVETDVPDWMDEQTYLNSHIELKYIQVLTGIENPTQIQFNNLCRLSENYRYFIGWLLERKKLNDFMQSILNQVMNWLNDPNPQHDRPLSPRQYETATRYCPIYKAKQVSERIYRY